MIAAIDVQGNRFVVQVIGYGEDRNRWVIDRYNIKTTERGPDTIKPALFDEDWNILKTVIDTDYPLIDGSGRRMAVAGVLCDSGGEPGVTDKAYGFYRRLETFRQNKFRLIKGAAKMDAPLIEQRWPDTRNRSDRRGLSHKDVPVLFLNTQRLKDRLDSDLTRSDDGIGFIHFPNWLGKWFFDELTREHRNAKGIWVSKAKNEAWDLMVYAEAGAIVGFPLGLRFKMQGMDYPGFWDDPPNWAKNWDHNTLIFDPNDREQEDSAKGRKSVVVRMF